MKKRIVTIALVVALVAIAAVGTLAYFTDTEEAENVFTTGGVDITLNDDFVQGSELLPAVMDEDNNILNAVDKVVSVTNNLKDAYVRLHIAVPASIDDIIGLWYDDATGWNWNEDTRVDYTTTIDGVEYNVVCLTYSELMKAGDKTTNVFQWVTMEPYATNEDVEQFENGTFKILVFAEGAQAAGFTDAFAALEAAFGTPSADANPWNNYGVTTDAE